MSTNSLIIFLSRAGASFPFSWRWARPKWLQFKQTNMAEVTVCMCTYQIIALYTLAILQICQLCVNEAKKKRSDCVWLLRLLVGHKKHWGFPSSSLSWITHSRGSQLPCQSISVESDVWQGNEASCQKSCEGAVLEVDPLALAAILMTTSSETLNQSHPSEVLCKFLTQRKLWDKYLLFQAAAQFGGNLS